MRKLLRSTPFIALALACSVCLSACGGPSTEGLIRQNLTEAFDEVNPQDEELLKSVEESGGGQFELLDIDPEAFMEAYLDGFTYEITDIAVDEENKIATGTVDVEMKSVTEIMAEFSTAFEDYISSIDPAAVPSEEELFQKGGELLMQAVTDAKPQKSEVIIDYKKNDDGEWEPEEDAEMALIDAML